MISRESREVVNPNNLVDPRTLSEDELQLRMTGHVRYKFTPINNEDELRASIANIHSSDYARFGREFETLTAGMPDAKATLVRIALDDKEPVHTHSHAMCALSKIGDREAIEALTAIINNSKFSGEIHYHAAQWIACIGSRDAVLALERIIFDADAPLSAKRGAVFGMDCWSLEPETDRVLKRVRSDRELFKKVRDCFGSSLHREWTE